MRSRSWFFTAMGVVAAIAVIVGFGRTYAVPMARQTFHAPVVVHIHGMFAAAWLLLFLVEPLLVRWRKITLHKQLGRLGLPLAIGIVLTMIPAGLFQVTRDSQAGGGPAAISALLGVLTSGVVFLALVTAGIITRRNREAHARWMLLATLFVIWPAWFRFRHYFPSVSNPDLWFGIVLAYFWIGVAAVRDRLVRGAVHPVIAWGGLAVVAETALEVIAFDSHWWRVAAHALYAWLQDSWLVQ